MVNLDDVGTIIEMQGGSSVLKSINSLPQQLNQSFSESLKIKFPTDFAGVKNIVVCGMGGSRFPSLIIRSLFKENLTVPYHINDDYILPGFVDHETLIILSSYSGSTEEVIACGQCAKVKGAKIAGIAMGGEVALFLKKIHAPTYIFNPTYNPSNQPRIGFGYNVGGHLGFLFNLGFIKQPKSLISQAIENLPELLKSFFIDVPVKHNPAKELAKKIYKRYPYYVVSEFLNGVGNAIANQTNETAKSISSFRVIPELNHHLMEGLKFPISLRNIELFVFFYSKLYSLQIQKRFKITKDVVEQNHIKTCWYELQGKNKVEQVFELMGLGSYVTMYLAALYKQNPSVIPYVEYFKQKLKKT